MTCKRSEGASTETVSKFKTKYQRKALSSSSQLQN